MVETSSSDFQPGVKSPSAPTSTGAGPVKLPFLLIVIAVTIFFPEELSFYFGERRMTVTRLVFLLIVPVIVFRFARTILREDYRFVWADALVPITSLWMFVGPAVNDGFDQTVVASGISALEFCVPYLAARLFLTERGQAVALVRLLCIAIATVGLLAILDEVARSWILREFIGRLTGYEEDLDVSDPTLGYTRGFLFRATSTMEHPILLGTVCTLGLLMASALRGPVRIFGIVGSIIGIVLSVSAAPILGGVMGFATLLYEKLTRQIPFRWTAVILIIVSAMLAIYVGRDDPLGFLLNHLTLDPLSGWYRALQWDCAGGLVLQSPIFGIGLSDEWVSVCGLAKTIDAVWLLDAMKYGIPGSILIFLCYMGGSSIPIGIKDASINLTEQERRLGFTLTIALGVASFIGLTVTFWGAVYILTIFLAGIRAHLGALGALPRDPLMDDDE